MLVMFEMIYYLKEEDFKALSLLVDLSYQRFVANMLLILVHFAELQPLTRPRIHNVSVVIYCFDAIYCKAFCSIARQ